MTLPVSGSIQSVLHMLTHLGLTQPYDVGTSILPILQMKKLRHEETKRSHIELHTK